MRAAPKLKKTTELGKPRSFQAMQAAETQSIIRRVTESVLEVLIQTQGVIRKVDQHVNRECKVVTRFGMRR